MAAPGTIRGANAAADRVVAQMEVEIPKRVEQLRAEWGLDEKELPMPRRFWPYEPPAIDHETTPAIAVTVERATDLGRDQQIDGGMEISATYPVRVYVWCIADSLGAAVRQRHDYAALIRLCLLDGLTLGRSDERDTLVEEDTLTEEYSDIAKAKGDRHIAGAFVGFDLTMTETVERDPIAIAATIDLDESVLPDTESV